MKCAAFLLALLFHFYGHFLETTAAAAHSVSIGLFVEDCNFVEKRWFFCKSTMDTLCSSCKESQR